MPGGVNGLTGVNTSDEDVIGDLVITGDLTLGSATTIEDVSQQFVVDDATWYAGVDYDGDGTNRPFKIAKTGPLGTGDVLSFEGTTGQTVKFPTITGGGAGKGVAMLADGTLQVGVGLNLPWVTAENIDTATATILEIGSDTATEIHMGSGGTTNHFLFGNSVTVAPPITLTGGVTGDLDPATGSSDIGSGTQKWKDIYLSGELISDKSIAFRHDIGGIGTIVLEDNTAGNDLTTGTNDIIIGRDAGAKISTAADTILIGHSAGRYAEGRQNTHVGCFAGEGNSATTGSAQYGTGIGFYSLYNVTAGSGNTAVGYKSGELITIGTFNTCVGYSAGCAFDKTNQTAIGNGALSTGSNEIALGNSSVTSFTCQVGLTVLSDERDKTNVTTLGEKALLFIDHVVPCCWDWNKRKLRQTIEETETPDTKEPVTKGSGFTAQNLLEASKLSGLHLPDLVDTRNPDRYGVTETKMLPILVKAVQELTARLEVLESK